MATRLDIVDEARSWLGVRYMHQGRTRNGIDCVGLLIVVAHNLGLSDFDIDGYSRVPSGHMMRRLLDEHLEPVDITDIGIGDVLHLRYASEPQHIAIISNIDPIRIVHADSIYGSVIEHRLDAIWRQMIRGCYRIPI